VDEHGAELRSLQEKADGTEYLWKGDPAWWKYSSPVLFPIVGKVVAGKYRVDGTEYELPGHGLGRISDFKLLEQTTDSISLALAWSPASLKVYPWKFRLEITYKLEEAAVRVSWKVLNHDGRDMYFSIGAHPALSCPIAPQDSFEDCYLHFEKPEKSSRLGLAGPFFTHDRVPCLQGQDVPLDYAWFKDGALAFDDLRSEQISICSKHSSKKITVQAKGFPYWGIWSPEKGGAPFVCIEPWFGHGDFVDFKGDFRQKAGIQKLAAGQEFTASYRLAIG
jgi:galactose mutarotase-like enzyme